jgi:hypothetical protein
MIDANGREWRIATAQTDLRRMWGVAISSTSPIAGSIRRFAVRATPGLSKAGAINEATPQLREWADNESWDRRKLIA